MDSVTQQQPDREQTPPQTPKRSWGPTLGWLVIEGLAILAIVLLNKEWGTDAQVEIDGKAFWKYAQQGWIVRDIIVKEDRIEGTLDGRTTGFRHEDVRDNVIPFYAKYTFADEQNFDQRLCDALAKNSGNSATFKYDFTCRWDGVLPLLLVTIGAFLAIFFLLHRMAAGGGGGFLGWFARLPQNPNRRLYVLGWIVVMGSVLLVTIFLIKPWEMGATKEIPSNVFWSLAENGKIAGEIIVKKKRIEGTLDGDTPGFRREDVRNGNIPFYINYAYQADKNFDQRLRSALDKNPSNKVSIKYD